MTRRCCIVILALGFLVEFGRPHSVAAATLQPQTIDAWNRYVAATEARIARELANGSSFLVSDFLEDGRQTRGRVLAGYVTTAEMCTTDHSGRAIAVPDGLIHHWRGSTFVRGVTLEGLLTRLKNPSEQGPHQEDVLALRVLERQADRLKLYIEMTRTKIVTVTYHTEHDVTYRRHGPKRASSRSVATKIVEVAGTGASAREQPQGEDHGFLWRLNSYWRFEQVEGGVIVELESLTLSRDIPSGLRFVVQPLIDRVARESMGRTLEQLRRAHAPALMASRR